MDNNQVSSKQFDQFYREWKKKDGTFGKMVDDIHDIGTYTIDGFRKVLEDEDERRLKEAEDERRRKKTELDDYHQKLERSTAGVIGSFKLLEGRAEHMSGAFSGLLRLVVPGAIGLAFAEIFQYGQELTKTYRTLVDTGQSFSGSIIEMSKAAADSGLTMTQYANLVAKNSEVQKRMQGTGKDLTSLAKSVRANAEQFGMFGYSVDDMNEVTAEYSKRQHSFATTASMSEKEMAEGSGAMAEQMTASANLFGKSRKQIMEDSSAAMKDAGFLGMMQQRTGEQFKEGNKRIEATINEFAALPGQMGKELPEMIAQGMATGTTAFTKQADTFVKAGVGNFMNIMDQASQNAMKGMDAEQNLLETNNAMFDEYQRALPQLTVMATHGNEQARQVIQQMQGMRRMSEKEFKDARATARNKDANTKRLLNIENQWSNTMAELRGKLLPFMELLLSAVGGVADVMMVLLKVLNVAVAVVASPLKLLGWLFGQLGDDTKTVAGVFGTAGTAVTGFIGSVGGAVLALGGMLAAIKLFKSGIVGVIKNGLGSIFDKVGLGSTFRNLFKGKDFTIKANHVTVIGGAIGGGAGGGKNIPFLEGAEKEHGAHHEHERDMNRKKGRFGSIMEKMRGHRSKMSGWMAGLLGMGEGLSELLSSPRPKGLEEEDTPHPGRADEAKPAPGLEFKKLNSAGSAGEEGGTFLTKIAKKFGFLGKFLGPLGKASGFLLRATGIFGKLQLFIGAIKIAGGIMEVLQGKKSMGEFLWDSFKTVVDGLLQAVLGPIDLILEAFGMKGLSDRLEEAIGLKKSENEKKDDDTTKQRIDMASPATPKDPNMVVLQGEADEAKKAIIQYQKDHPDEIGTPDLLKKLGDIQDRIREQTLIGARQGSDLIDVTKKNSDKADV